MRTERSIQLSYGAVDKTEALIGAAGFEPATYGFKVRCSNLGGRPLELRPYSALQFLYLVPQKIPKIDSGTATEAMHLWKTPISRGY